MTGAQALLDAQSGGRLVSEGMAVGGLWWPVVSSWQWRSLDATRSQGKKCRRKKLVGPNFDFLEVEY